MTSSDNLSESNSHDNFTEVSPIDGHLRAIMREIGDQILVHHSDWATFDHLLRHSDITLTGWAIRVVTDCYNCCLYAFIFTFKINFCIENQHFVCIV